MKRFDQNITAVLIIRKFSTTLLLSLGIFCSFAYAQKEAIKQRQQARISKTETDNQ